MSNRAEFIKAELKRKTGNQGLLSFANGIKNVIGARATGSNIRLRLINQWATDVVVLIAPKMLLGTSDGATALASDLGLPTGIPFYTPSSAETGGTGKNFTIASLDPAQKLAIIASQLSNEPTQITGISMKSYTTAGIPENTNYGNSLIHYRVSHLEETKRSTPLNFDAFQNSKDVSTEILKIDLVKNNFMGLVSQKDVLAIQINAGTRMDLTLHIGARASMEEFTFREIKAGAEVLREQFGNEELFDGSCNC